MTNGDRIRLMTNEQLAEVLVESCDHCAFDGDRTMCRDSDCKTGYLAWLKQKATDDHDGEDK